MAYCILFLKERELILFCPHQSEPSAYCQRTNQVKLENLNLDVFLPFLYLYVGKIDKNYWHVIVVHYPQPVADIEEKQQ